MAKLFTLTTLASHVQKISSVIKLPCLPYIDTHTDIHT